MQLKSVGVIHQFEKSNLWMQPPIGRSDLVNFPRSLDLVDDVSTTFPSFSPCGSVEPEVSQLALQVQATIGSIGNLGLRLNHHFWGW